jgi:hypothetical protein
MASQILGLFTSPQQYQQQQQDLARARAMEYAKLDPFQQANTAIGQGAYGLAGAIGGALGGVDPQLQKITMRQQLASQLNPADLDSFKTTAEAAKNAGDYEFAMAIADAGRQAAIQVAQANKERQMSVAPDIQKAQQAASISQAIDSYKAMPETPEIKRAINTLELQLGFLAPKAEKVPDALQVAKRVSDIKAQLSPDTGVMLPPNVRAGLESELGNLEKKEKSNIIDVGVAEKTREVVYFDKDADQQFVMKPSPTDPTKLVRSPYSGGIDKTTAKVSASSSSKGADEGAKTISELSAKRVDAAKVSAGKAMEQAGLLQELLKTPQPISGSGAPVRVGALRVFSTFGLTSPKDDEALGNADKFNALAGERVISFIKALGSNPTDTDREFARTIGPALEKGTKTNADLINFLLERARKVVKDADAIENYFYDNNYSLRGYKSPFMTDLETPKSMASDKPVSQMTRQELLDEEARLLGNKKP